MQARPGRSRTEPPPVVVIRAWPAPIPSVRKPSCVILIQGNASIIGTEGRLFQRDSGLPHVDSALVGATIEAVGEHRIITVGRHRRAVHAIGCHAHSTPCASVRIGIQLKRSLFGTHRTVVARIDGRHRDVYRFRASVHGIR